MGMLLSLKWLVQQQLNDDEIGLGCIATRLQHDISGIAIKNIFGANKRVTSFCFISGSTDRTLNVYFGVFIIESGSESGSNKDQPHLELHVYNLTYWPL